MHCIRLLLVRHATVLLAVTAGVFASASCRFMMKGSHWLRANLIGLVVFALSVLRNGCEGLLLGEGAELTQLTAYHVASELLCRLTAMLPVACAIMAARGRPGPVVQDQVTRSTIIVAFGDVSLMLFEN
jgi:hypothetical protein